MNKMTTEIEYLDVSMQKIVQIYLTFLYALDIVLESIQIKQKTLTPAEYRT